MSLQALDDSKQQTKRSKATARRDKNAKQARQLYSARIEALIEKIIDALHASDDPGVIYADSEDILHRKIAKEIGLILIEEPLDPQPSQRRARKAAGEHKGRKQDVQAGEHQRMMRVAINAGARNKRFCLFYDNESGRAALYLPARWTAYLAASKHGITNYVPTEFDLENKPLINDDGDTHETEHPVPYTGQAVAALREWGELSAL